MRIVQFEVPGTGRRVGIVDAQGEQVSDLTARAPDLPRVHDVFLATRQRNVTFQELLADLCSQSGLPGSINYFRPWWLDWTCCRHHRVQ